MYYYNNELPPQNGWICPRCGKVNAPWLPCCVCDEPSITYTSDMAAPVFNIKNEPQTETPYVCKICPYHNQCSAEDWRSCRYDYVSGRYIDPQTERRVSE